MSGKMQLCNFYMDPEKWQGFKTLAEDKGLKASAYLRFIINQMVEEERKRRIEDERAKVI